MARKNTCAEPDPDSARSKRKEARGALGKPGRTERRRQRRIAERREAYAETMKNKPPHDFHMPGSGKL